MEVNMEHLDTDGLAYAVLELEHVRYTVVRETVFLELCRRAGVAAQASAGEETCEAVEVDNARLARRLSLRRKEVGLTQAELARRAGVRVETLNRLERGRTTPDFATVRKLVVAMNATEAEQSRAALASRQRPRSRR
jgi:DNA-binding XRE family transcriptional regulator